MNPLLIEFITLKLSDDRLWYGIKIDGEIVFDVGDGEPEDNNLRRNFNDCFKLPEIMLMVVQAVQAGREVKFRNVSK